MKKMIFGIFMVTMITSCMDRMCQVSVVNNSTDTIDVVVNYDSAGLVKWFIKIQTANAFLQSTVPSWQTPGRYDSVALKSFFKLPVGTKAIITSELASEPNWVYIKEIEVLKGNKQLIYHRKDFDAVFKKSSSGIYILSVD